MEKNLQLIKRCVLTPVSLTIKERLPYKEWEAIGLKLKTIDGAVQWWIGDWIIYGENEYGEMYSQALNELNYTYGTLRNIVYTAKNVNLSRRRDNLDFTKHLEIAQLEPKEQEKWLDKIEKEKLTRKQIRTLLKRSKLNLPKLKGEARIDIKLGDFQKLILDIPENSISAIITDPPYPEEYLPLWEALAKEAARVLKPSGFLIAYSGQKFLPQVIELLKDSLTYYWLMALYHKGPTGQRFEVNMWNRFKPILVFQKPPYKQQLEWIEDVVVSEKPDKEKHEWGQSVEPFEKLIKTFTNEGDTILDPFFGGGAVLEAANNTKRHIIGYEIDKEYFNLVKQRI